MEDIKIVDDQGLEIKQPEKQPITSEYAVDAPALPQLEEKAIGNVLGLEKDSDLDKYKDNIGLLLRYAKGQTEDHSLESLKWVIRSLEMKLGSAPISEKRINYVARYAYLDMESKKIEKEKQQFIKHYV